MSIDDQDRLREVNQIALAKAEKEIEKLQADHQQYVEWASPQLERLGREMAENEQLRDQLTACQLELDMLKEAAIPVHPDPSGKTREPPHCPSCSCPVPQTCNQGGDAK